MRQLGVLVLGFCLLVFPHLKAQAFNDENAWRGANESFESALERYLLRNGDTERARYTALSRAKPYRQGVDISALPNWNASDQTMQTAFEKARDERVYFESRRPRFARRASWLYPDDGCYARATHIDRSFRYQSYARPGRVFAFGKLRLPTKYRTKGVAYWWYHVAAGFRIGNDPYVLDPSVEPLSPLPLEEWLHRFSSNIGGVKISICDENAYGPRSRCLNGQRVSDEQASYDQKKFLSAEWNRLKKLRYDPRKLLGENPPWLSSSPRP